ncbi:MAG: trypsin-like peptidase domain-containing protein, partial [Actinomycetia bacterium]|nr:trypsin-like peptidase domain-containing protein [Actinomycetes bacterium]
MPQPAVLRNQPPTGRTSVYTAQSQPTMPRPAQPPTAYRPTAQPVASQLAQLTPSQPLKKPVSRLALFMTSLGGVIVGGVLVFALIFAWTGGFAQQPTTSSGDITAESLNSTATAQDSNPGPVQIQPTTPITITPLSEDATLSEAVAAKCLPSVVNIDVYVKSSSANGSSQGWSDSTNDSSLLEYALGSGVVLTEDGYILTNYHVVEAGDEFLVRFDKDTQLRAVLVGFDESSDLAVLKVDATGLTPMEMGDSSALLPGQWVMALGSPFGLDKSVSVGIVSALFRSTTMEGVNALTIYANMIQTDAAINPGNSGGALVNAQGQLIGINTLIMSATDSSAGVGFAIPSNYAWNIAQQIMAGKTVEHAFLGVQMTTVDPSTAASLHTTATAGAYVNQVVNGSPAAQAGIQTGDVIVRVG